MKIISIRKEQILIVFYIIIISAGLIFTFKNQEYETVYMPLSQKVVLIDAGHGGWDPGMVTEDNTLEKDLNLQVALKLQQYLEQSGCYVIMTRATDEALGDTKMNDMRQRKQIANEQQADIMVSIHQNSYPKESVHGAQVFYYNESEKSKLLAECIQTEINNVVDPTSTRTAKPNSDYYMLKQTSIPAVIIECGFMTNPTDLTNLQDENYQAKLAWAIYLGIIDYFEAVDQI